MGNVIAITHTGKLGDFLYCLQVGSWLYKRYKRKIHWVLPNTFGPFRYIENLLLAQEQTSRVTLVDHQIENYGCGGQPYKFDPATFGIEGEYFNLGFRGYPNKFIPAFYAEEHGLGYDPDFVLKTAITAFDDRIKYDKLTRVACCDDSGKWRSSELAMQMIMPDVQSLPTTFDLLSLAKLMVDAKEIHSWYSGIAVLCWLARIPAHVYRVKEHAPMEIYFPDERNLIFHLLDKHPKEMVKA
jgi:hypothetical protein